jgi:hypothetical protein
MSARDARGRFMSADEAAAMRLLEAAVRRAREVLRGHQCPLRPQDGCLHLDAATSMLTAAGTAADLLLEVRDA